MYRRFLPFAALSFVFLSSSAQLSKNTAYAITGDVPGSYNWTEIRIVDLTTGQSVKPVFSSKESFAIRNARTGQSVSNSNIADQPFATMAAAAAYDAQHNRLYYTPMGINQLRYIDLNQSTPTFNYLVGEEFGVSKGIQDQPNHITRMVIDAGGVGYALSNDGEHFIKFTTGRKMKVTNLGTVADNSSNKVSIHSACTSYGGDMVAAADGKLYLVSAFNHVFSIDVDSKMATYLGRITGLPDNFTSNGAAVNDEGQLIVSCATISTSYYLVDMKTLQATQVKNGTGFYNTSDLANGNLLFQQTKTVAPADLKPIPAAHVSSEIGIYPNPVTEGYFKMTFNNVEKGTYEVQLVDIVGRVVSKKSINISVEGQVEQIDVKAVQAKGMFMVRLVDQSQKIVYTNKVMVQ